MIFESVPCKEEQNNHMTFDNENKERRIFDEDDDDVVSKSQKDLFEDKDENRN